jgi:hypothetical protein
MRFDAAGVQRGVWIDGMSEAQAVSVNAQAEARRVAREADLAVVSPRHALNLVPIVGGQDVGAGSLQVGRTDRHEVVVGTFTPGDDLNRHFPEGARDPVAGVDVVCQEELLLLIKQNKPASFD